MYIVYTYIYMCMYVCMYVYVCACMRNIHMLMYHIFYLLPSPCLVAVTQLIQTFCPEMGEKLRVGVVTALNDILSKEVIL